jgi:hypothetical protein
MPALFGIGAEVAPSANCGCVGVKSDEHHLAQLLGLQRDWVGAEWTIAGLAVARGKVAGYLADGVVTDLLAGCEGAPRSRLWACRVPPSYE